MLAAALGGTVVAAPPLSGDRVGQEPRGLAAVRSNSPFIRAGFENGIAAPWYLTPTDDAALFQLAHGFRSRRSLALIVRPNSYAAVPGSEMTAVWLRSEVARAGRGADAPTSTWYRVRLRFPRLRYKPTPGEWNWLVVWHNDSATSAYHHAYSIAMGVTTDTPTQGRALTPGRRPRLFLRLMGGLATAPQTQSIRLKPSSLRYDHWYNVLFHFVWSPDPKVGLAEWWVDGKRKASVAFPTLYTLPDGSHSYNGFGLYNYRLSAPWSSEVDFDDVVIGPDRSSVSP